MHISGRNSIVLKDVLIGDVWLCSGQSNMALQVANSNNAEEEIAAAEFPLIRLFQVPSNLQLAPVEDLPEGEWTVCDPETVGGFSAVGYFFGQDLHEELDVPIGLINSSWGGTNVETWTSREMAITDPEMRKAAESIKDMDLEGMKRKLEAERRTLLASLGELEPGMVDGLALWAAEELDVSEWKPMIVPGLWEEQGLEDVDGVIWFRRDVELSAEHLESPAVLKLGAIDDNDLCWINGVKVGETNAYNKARIYDIPKDILRKGRNTIVVRVEDTGGGGGFSGEAEKILFNSTGGDIPLAGEWLYRVSSESFSASSGISVHPNSKPTLLYNGMIQPLVNYPIKGAIWYQGESNAAEAYKYRSRFPNLIRDWRNKWQNPLMGFYFVQLANFMEVKDEPGESDWALLREAQAMTLALPKTGMAVTIDIGETDDIHPRNKQDVGRRLALAALHDTYGKDVVYSGPVYKSMKLEGSKVILELDPMGSALEVRDKYGYVKGFSIAGEDMVFHWARGVQKESSLILVSDKVDKPVAVRYGWADNPLDANLYNVEGLPASPFRTDDWPELHFEE